MSHIITNLGVRVWEHGGFGKGDGGLQLMKDAKIT